jgi:hypothetical protein
LFSILNKVFVAKYHDSHPVLFPAKPIFHVNIPASESGYFGRQIFMAVQAKRGISVQWFAALEVGKDVGGFGH